MKALKMKVLTYLLGSQLFFCWTVDCAARRKRFWVEQEPYYVEQGPPTYGEMEPPVYSEVEPPQYGEIEYQQPCRGTDSTTTQSTTTTTRPTTQTTRAITPTTRPTTTTLTTTTTRPTTTTILTTTARPTTTTTTPRPTTTTTTPTTTTTRPTTTTTATTTTTTTTSRPSTTTTTTPTTTPTRPTTTITTATTTTQPTTKTTLSTTTTTPRTTTPAALPATTKTPAALPTTTTTAKPITAPAPTPPPVQPCHNTTKADIILLLDASTSIGSINWQKQVKFADEVTQAFTVGANDVRFGTLTFNKSPTKIFDLKTHFDHQSISQAILSIEYPYRSGTNTHLGLKEIREQKLFSPENGGRDGVKNIVIVMTDGLSTIPTLTQEEATLLKNEDVTLISVGIGSGVDKTELQGIASKPAYVFLTGGYDLLDFIKRDLVKMTCESVSY